MKKIQKIMALIICFVALMLAHLGMFALVQDVAYAEFAVSLLFVVIEMAALYPEITGGKYESRESY